MPPISDEIPDPERGGCTRLDPERAGGNKPVDLARTGVVPERQGDKPVDPAPTGGKDVDARRQGLKGVEIDRGSVDLGREGVEDAHPEHDTVKAVDPHRQGLKGFEIDRGSVGLGREGVEDVHPERDSVNGVEPPRGGMNSELLKDSDLARGATKDADLAGGASKVADLSTGASKDADPIPDCSRKISDRFPEEPFEKMCPPAPTADSENSALRPKDERRFPHPRSGDPQSLAKAVIKEIVDELQPPHQEKFIRRLFPKRRPSRPGPMPGPMSRPRIRYREIGWPSTGREWNSYRMLNRAEAKALKKELKEAVVAFEQGSKLFKTNSDELRAVHEKLKKLIEQYADLVKAGLDNEAAMLNISIENAAHLKLLVEELKQAAVFSKSGKSVNVAYDFQKFFRSGGLKACKNLTLLAAIVATVVVAAGCIEFDPSSFDPRHTKAGKLLYDDFVFGLKVKCISSVGLSDKITTLLSGELDALQSELTIHRILENWSCELAVSPGRDAIVKARIKDMWVKGLKIDLNVPIYDGLQRKVEFDKKYIFGSVGGALGLNGNPLLSLNAKFGTKQLSGGVLVDYDMLPGFLRRFAVGGVFNIFGISGSLMMERILNLQAAGQQQAPQPAVGHQVTGTLFVQASEATAVGAELTHRMEAQETTVAVGVEHHVDSATAVKCRLTNQWHLTALVQHKVGENAVLSLTGMVDMANLEAAPRLGLSFSFAT